MALLWAERMKLKRSKIVWIAVFSAIMAALIVFMQGQFHYYGKRYVDEAAWFMTATHSLGSMYVFPAMIALIGSYIICRETQDDTMKSLVLIPVHMPKLIGAKLMVTALYSVALYAFLFLVTFSVEVFLHGSLLNLDIVLHFAKLYLIEGFCIFLAVSPIIAIVYQLKKGYWLALIFAEIYSFFGLFASMESTMCALYPITAAFCVSGYYEVTPIQFTISLISLLSCGILSVIVCNCSGQREYRCKNQREVCS